MAYAVNSALDKKSLLHRYLELPSEKGQFMATYVWIDGSGENVRCKTMTLSEEPKSVKGELSIGLVQRT